MRVASVGQASRDGVTPRPRTSAFNRGRQARAYLVGHGADDAVPYSVVRKTQVPVSLARAQVVFALLRFVNALVVEGRCPYFCVTYRSTFEPLTRRQRGRRRRPKRWSPDAGTVTLHLEFASDWSLASVPESTLTATTLAGICSQTAIALVGLSRLAVVHGDAVCSNILLQRTDPAVRVLHDVQFAAPRDGPFRTTFCTGSYLVRLADWEDGTPLPDPAVVASAVMGLVDGSDDLLLRLHGGAVDLQTVLEEVVSRSDDVVTTLQPLAIDATSHRLRRAVMRELQRQRDLADLLRRYVAVVDDATHATLAATACDACGGRPWSATPLGPVMATRHLVARLLVDVTRLAATWTDATADELCLLGTFDAAREHPPPPPPAGVSETVEMFDVDGPLADYPFSFAEPNLVCSCYVDACVAWLDERIDRVA
jgi:hypothetical protein